MGDVGCEPIDHSHATVVAEAAVLTYPPKLASFYFQDAQQQRLAAKPMAGYISAERDPTSHQCLRMAQNQWSPMLYNSSWMLKNAHSGVPQPLNLQTEMTTSQLCNLR
nr:hypothetical protein Iba_chr10eCG16130 [Ipomoea batatas]